MKDTGTQRGRWSAWICGIVAAASLAVALPLALARRCTSDAERIARAFVEGTVRTEFLSHAVTVRGTLRLQVAEVTTGEVFHATDAKKIMGIPLPDVEADIRGPVTYTYVVPLEKEKWTFTLDKDKGTVRIEAPPILANEPAPHYSQWKESVSTSVWRIGEDEVLLRLRGGVTPALRGRALQHVDDLNIRPLAARSVETLFKEWFGPFLEKLLGPGGGKEVARFGCEVVFAPTAVRE